MDSDERLTVSIEEAGRAIGLSRGAAYLAAKRGELPTIKFGRRLFVSKAVLSRLLSGEMSAPTGKAS